MWALAALFLPSPEVHDRAFPAHSLSATPPSAPGLQRNRQQNEDARPWVLPPISAPGPTIASPRTGSSTALRWYAIAPRTAQPITPANFGSSVWSRVGEVWQRRQLGKLVVPVLKRAVARRIEQPSRGSISDPRSLALLRRLLPARDPRSRTNGLSQEPITAARGTSSRSIWTSRSRASRAR